MLNLGVNQIVHRCKNGREGKGWGEERLGNPSKHEIQRSGGHGGTRASPNMKYSRRISCIFLNIDKFLIAFSFVFIFFNTRRRKEKKKILEKIRGCKVKGKK